MVDQEIQKKHAILQIQPKCWSSSNLRHTGVLGGWQMPHWLRGFRMVCLECCYKLGRQKQPNCTHSLCGSRRSVRWQDLPRIAWIQTVCRWERLQRRQGSWTLVHLWCEGHAASHTHWHPLPQKGCAQGKKLKFHPEKCTTNFAPICLLDEIENEAS